MFLRGAVGTGGSGGVCRSGEKWAATPREEEGASPPVARALGGGWAVAIRMRGPAARRPAGKAKNRAAVPGRRMAPPPVAQAWEELAGAKGNIGSTGGKSAARRNSKRWATVPGRRMAPSPVARALGGGWAIAISVCALATRRPDRRAEDWAAVPGRRMAPPPFAQAWEEMAGAKECSDRQALCQPPAGREESRRRCHGRRRDIAASNAGPGRRMGRRGSGSRLRERRRRPPDGKLP